MNGLERVLECRRLLADLTPLKGDCGRLCGHACCGADENGKGGMLLFPGEEALYEGKEGFSFLPDETVVPGGKLLVCGGSCLRADRPLACRFFPLRPTSRGRAVPDRRSAWVCPLYEGGSGALDPAFVDAAGQAAALLCGDEGLKAFVAAVGRRIRRDLEQGMFETEGREA